jgi:DNA polymerase (family 10)
MYNKKISQILDEIADMLELEEGDHKFEIRAYKKAALNLETMQEDVSEIISKKGLSGLYEIPGVGKNIALKIQEFINTNHIKKHEELKKKYPIDFQSLTLIPGLGPKRIFKLYTALGVKDLPTLKKAIELHKIIGIEGFSDKSENDIKKGISLIESSNGRMPLGNALPEAESIVKKINSSNFVELAVLAGSCRRMKETVGDFDILVVSDDSSKIMNFITSMEEVENVVLKGDTKITIKLKIGINCDIRVVEKASFGSALQYFTGSKDHGIHIRQIAVKKGYKLSEYGLFDNKGKQIAGKNETEVYNKLGMDYIEPEMRENRGEIELAMSHNLPKLIELGDILGDLHTHTTHSDGTTTILDMAEHAKAIGRKYIGISDHTKNERTARGMDDNGFKKYFKEIDEINKKIDSITILKSAEVDILNDGSLDLKPETLKQMDYVLATVHTNRNMDNKVMTNRIVTAMKTGLVDIIVHPTGRIINEREPMQMDLDKIFQTAYEYNIAMEINSYPERLDLNDENAIRARDYHLKFSINTDAHSITGLEFMRYGVGVARRAWLTKKNILNTLPVDKLLKSFNK